MYLKVITFLPPGFILPKYPFSDKISVTMIMDNKTQARTCARTHTHKLIQEYLSSWHKIKTKI